MCLTLPPRSQVLEATLKGMYLSFVRHCKGVNVHSMPSIIFMSNCLCEIYGVDLNASYQHGFVYIRQLAIHLRGAIQKASSEATRSVYNWQYLNSLRVWAQVLASHAADPRSALAPLVYPFVQVCLGTIELSGAPGYYPVRFVVCEFLNLVAEKCKVYVPLAPHLLTVLNSASLLAFRKPLKGNAARLAREKRVSDLKFKLHVSAAVMGSEAYQTLQLTRCFDMLTQHLAIYSHSIAFPELVLPVKFLLRRFSKASKNKSAVAAARQLLSAVSDTAQGVLLRRVGVTFSPRDLLAKGVSGVDTLKHPDVMAALNNAAAAAAAAGADSGAFGVLAGASGAAAAAAALATAVRGAGRQTQLEALWAVRYRNSLDEDRKEIVVGADKARARAAEDEDEDVDGINVRKAVAEGDADDEDDDEVGPMTMSDEDGDDEDDDDDDDEDDEDAPKKQQPKSQKLSVTERIAAAAKLAAQAAGKKGSKGSKRAAPSAQSDDDEEQEQKQAQEEDLDLSDSEDDGEAAWGSDVDDDDLVQDMELTESESEDESAKQRKRRAGAKAAKAVNAGKKGGPAVKRARK